MATLVAVAQTLDRPIVIRQECLKLGGDLAVGALLSQIVYWYLPSQTGQSKLRVPRDGVYWIAKTREAWMAETGLTLEQYKRAIGVLKRKKLVDVRVMRFGGLAISHVRLLQSIAGAVVQPATHVGAKPPAAWSHTHHPVGVFQTNLKVTETTAESTTGSGATSCATGKAETISEGETGREKAEQSTTLTIVGKELPTMKAADILKQHTAPTNGSLGCYWKSRMAIVMGKPQVPLTGQQHGQLKQLSKNVGDQIRPLIDYAINHWWTFAIRAGAVAGVQPPVQPHIGFLLKHYAVAMDLLLPQPDIALPPVVVQPVQSIAPVTETEEVHVLSSQELTELLDSFKSP